jgi:hypothetical protein
VFSEVLLENEDEVVNVLPVSTGLVSPLLYSNRAVRFEDSVPREGLPSRLLRETQPRQSSKKLTAAAVVAIDSEQTAAAAASASWQVD